METVREIPSSTQRRDGTRGVIGRSVHTHRAPGMLLLRCCDVGLRTGKHDPIPQKAAKGRHISRDAANPPTY